MPDKYGKMTNQEFKDWWVALHAHQATIDMALPPKLVTGIEACGRCGGTGIADVRWIGRIRCGACGGGGRRAEIEEKANKRRKGANTCQ